MPHHKAGDHGEVELQGDEPSTRQNPTATSRSASQSALQDAQVSLLHRLLVQRLGDGQCDVIEASRVKPLALAPAST